MPFTKIGPNKYRSPSGRTFNEAQVRLYYAHGGSFPGQKSGEGDEAEGRGEVRSGDPDDRASRDYYGGLKGAAKRG